MTRVLSLSSSVGLSTWVKYMTKAEKREYDIKYRADNPGYDKKRHKEYRLVNLKKVKTKDKIRKHESYKKNPEKFKLRNNTWAENNPEKTKNRRLMKLYAKKIIITENEKVEVELITY